MSLSFLLFLFFFFHSFDSMPKIKPGHKGIRQSIIAPYFLKRSDKPHVDLHEFIAMGCTVPVSTTYPAPWADPDILSQTNVYRLTWACKFPSLMESAIKSRKRFFISLYFALIFWI